MQGETVQHHPVAYRQSHSIPVCSYDTGLFRVSVAGAGVQFLTTQELRDRARRCRFLWKVRTLCGGNMDQQVEQPAARAEISFVLCCGVLKTVCKTQLSRV